MEKGKYDVVIVGAGPGGVAAGIRAAEAGMSYVILEKGKGVFQGVIDSFPRGKAVYPTIPKGVDKPFPIQCLEPPKDKVPVEKYIDQIEKAVQSQKLNIVYNESFENLEEGGDGYVVKTEDNDYAAKNVILAFGSNIPNDLGIYGEAKAVARKLDNLEEYIWLTALVIGGGNAAADIVAALSKAKREAVSPMPVYWAHRKEMFRINKDTARDLGEELLLGGQIRILQGAIPKIGEVDAEGIDRLYLYQTPNRDKHNDVFMYQGMSFPMKNVIACIGSQGPAEVFNQLNLKQVAREGGSGKSGSASDLLLLLDESLQTNRKGVYAIGGAISPSIMEIQEDGAFQQKKHPNLIYTAIEDGVIAMDGVIASGQAGG